MGIGHLMRCLALAQCSRARQTEPLLISNCPAGALRERLEMGFAGVVSLETSHPDPEDLRETLSVLSRVAPEGASGPRTCIVLDGYHFDAEYQEALRDAGFRLLVIDDNADRPEHCADMLLNHNVHAAGLAYHRSRDVRMLLGPRYALLRTEFRRWHSWKREIPDVARKVLVTLGGGDATAAVSATVRSLEQLRARDLEVRIVIGPTNLDSETLRSAPDDGEGRIRLVRSSDDMPALMAWADVAISSGGGTCLELAFMGVPSVVLVTADNQRQAAQTLSSMGMVAGPHEATGKGSREISDSLDRLIGDGEMRARMSQWGRLLVDGTGAERVIRAVEHSDSCGENGAMSLRTADESDAFWLWQLANDPVAREFSLNHGAIPWADHVDWLAEVLEAPDRRLWIAEEQGMPVASIRFDRCRQQSAQVSFAVTPDQRGRGLGTRLLAMASDRACGELGVQKIVGTVFSQNVGSVRAFQKAGFKREGTGTGSPQHCVAFARQCPSRVSL